MKRKYLFKDEDTLNAVKFHTIPRSNPTLLEKIVFCAHQISSRKHRETDYELIDLCISNLEEDIKTIFKINIESIKELYDWNNYSNEK